MYVLECFIESDDYWCTFWSGLLNLMIPGGTFWRVFLNLMIPGVRMCFGVVCHQSGTAVLKKSYVTRYRESQ